MVQEVNGRLIKFLVKRGELTKINIAIYLGEYVTNFTVIAGYGGKLRTALNAMNLKIYDDRTARFDSPYQTGNCGGEGTCGTCVVGILQGEIFFEFGNASKCHSNWSN